MITAGASVTVSGNHPTLIYMHCKHHVLNGPTGFVV
jgi:hypothetical protein